MWTWVKFLEYIAYYQDFAGGRALYNPSFDKLALYSRHSKHAPFENTMLDMADFERAILKQDRMCQYLFLSLWICHLGFKGVSRRLGWSYDDVVKEAYKARSMVYQTLKGFYGGK